MPPKAIFKGHTFALSGKLALPRKEYEELIRKHGGEVASSVTTSVTFLVSTEDDVKAVSQKVATAVGRKLPIVQEGFVGACVTAKRLLEPSKFALKTPAAKKRASSKGAASSDAPKPAKAAKVVGEVVLGSLPVIAKSGLADKAAVVEERIEKGFVKGSLAWDVELVLNDVAAGKDKFYNMQLLASTAGDEYWAVQNWGKTGMEGRVKVDGPFADLASAKRVFRKKYRAKTGNVFGEMGASFLEKDGKYKLLAKEEKKKDDTPGVWQYYLHNEVDGKKVGWYQYDADAAKNMEKYWKQFENNAGLEVRIVQTDYFRYEVNFSEMIQRNIKSGMRRVVRRIAAGERPSPSPPDEIPEKAEPEAAPPPDDPSEEEVEGEEDDEAEEDDEEEVMDAAEEPAAEEPAAEASKAPAAGTSRSAPSASASAPSRTAPASAPAASVGGRAAPASAPARAAPAGGRAAPAAAAAADPEADTVPMDAETLPLRGGH